MFRKAMVAMLCAGVGMNAWAGDAHEEGSSKPPKVSRTHRYAYELNLGFASQNLDHSLVPLRLVGDATVPGAAAVVSPFAAEPYNAYDSMGGQIGLLVAVNGVRMGASRQYLYPSFQMNQALSKEEFMGVEQQVGARSIRLSAWQFALGYEPLQFKRAAPFVDLVGTYHHMTTDLTIDGENVRYQGEVFGFSVRGGGRLRVAPGWHLVGSGEYGLQGASNWGAQLGVALRFPISGR